MFGLDTFADLSPGDLNFFFGINVTFSGQSIPVPLLLGQGHQALTGANNWWIGGGSVHSSDGAATLTLPDGSQLTISGGEGSHTFRLFN